MSPVSRDWLDILVATFTVSTGVVIALAALLALVVQRGRYLKEIEPDLRLAELPAFRYLGPEGTTFAISWQIDNTSANPAKGLAVSWDFEIAEVAVPATAIILMQQGGYKAFGNVPEVQLRYPNLLPGRTNHLITRCHVDLQNPTIMEILGSQRAVDVGNIRVRVRATVRYSNVGDFTSFLFMPWRLGLAKYVRSAEIDIAFRDAGEGSTPRYQVEPEGVRVQ